MLMAFLFIAKFKYDTKNLTKNSIIFSIKRDCGELFVYCFVPKERNGLVVRIRYMIDNKSTSQNVAWDKMSPPRPPEKI